MAALENIIEGKSKWLLHDFTGRDGGYMNIRRCVDAGGLTKYKVELVQWMDPRPAGYHIVISDVALLRRWLWDFVTERNYPENLSEWEEFNVEDHFRRLVFRFLGEDDNLNKEDYDER